ncbi:MAG: nucleotidyltransferase domain-containing protein [Thermoprotei archaeon]|nr:nucleotidyltransferase domain-containing protein [Thermoprotei archaeon]
MKRTYEGLQYPFDIILRELLKKLKQRFGENLISVVLYGSVARGEARKDIDVDLLIIFKSAPKSRFRRQELFMKVEDELEPLMQRFEAEGYHIEFTPVLKTVEEAKRMTPLYLDMVEDARILFDRGDFFAGILSKLRKRLKELGAERKRMGKRWYWVLKKDYRFGEVIEIG